MFIENWGTTLLIQEVHIYRLSLLYIYRFFNISIFFGTECFYKVVTYIVFVCIYIYETACCVKVSCIVWWRWGRSIWVFQSYVSHVAVNFVVCDLLMNGKILLLEAQIFL